VILPVRLVRDRRRRTPSDQAGHRDQLDRRQPAIAVDTMEEDVTGDFADGGEK